MAGSLAQHRVDARPELLQQIEGDEGLDRSGEAAAVDPVGTPALEIVLTQGKAHSHVLVLGVARGDDILQIHVGGVAALLDQLQELGEVPLPQGGHLQGHPGVLLVEVDGPEDGPVRAGFPELGDGREEVLLVNLGQDLFAEEGADLL